MCVPKNEYRIVKCLDLKPAGLFFTLFAVYAFSLVFLVHV